MNDLVVIEQVNAVQVFDGRGLDPLLDKITKEVRSFVPDVSTAKGRKEIASIAHKVAQSKTLLDGAGKNLVSGWKEKAKVVDAERKRMRDSLDLLKKEVREPLDVWEENERSRVDGIKLKISNIALLSRESDDSGDCYSSLVLSGNLETVRKITVDDSFAEFANDAAIEKDKSITTLENLIGKRKREEVERAELERLRLEKEAHEKAEADELLRREGEERARREADEKAETERQRVEMAERERVDKERREREKIEAERNAAIAAKEEAERNAKEAEERAIKEKEEAVRRERDRIEAEKKAEEAATRKREADKKHKASINNAILSSLVSVGLDERLAKIVVTSVASGKIPHISIRY